MSHRINRRNFVRLASLTGAGIAMASCAPTVAPTALASKGNEAAKVSGTLNVLTLGGGIFGLPFTDEKVKGEWSKLYPDVKINNITLGYDEAVKKYAAAFVAGSDQYDVVQIDYIYCAGFAKAGHLVSLNDRLGSWFGDFQKDTSEGAIAGYTLNGVTYGLPTIGNCQRFIYNKAILEKEGFQPPDTWDQLLEISKKVHKPDKNQYGFAAGVERLVKAAGIWLPIFWSNGGELFDKDWHPTVNTDAGVQSLEYLIELVEYMPPGGANFTEADEIKAVGSGTTVFQPFAWIPDAITNPSNPAVAQQLETKVQPKGSVRNSPVMGGLGLVVPKYSKNQEAALEYLKWYNSAEVQKNLIIPAGGQPCRTSAWEANLNVKPYFKGLLENLKVAKVRPGIPEYGAVDGAIGLQMSRAFNKEVTPKEALDEAQKQIEKIMKDAGYLS